MNITMASYVDMLLKLLKSAQLKSLCIRAPSCQTIFLCHCMVTFSSIDIVHPTICIIKQLLNFSINVGVHAFGIPVSVFRMIAFGSEKGPSATVTDTILHVYIISDRKLMISKYGL